MQAASAAQVNWPTVIASVIGGSAVGALITFIGTSRLKRTDFEYDYSKHILGKRKQAYEEIESLIISIHHFNRSLHAFENFDEQNKDTHFQVLKNDFFEIRRKVQLVTSTPSMWVNPRLIDRFRALGLFLEMIKKPIENGQMTFQKDDIARLRVGITYIVKQFFKDIGQLHKIEEFKQAVLHTIIWDQRLADQELLQAVEKVNAK